MKKINKMLASIKFAIPILIYLGFLTCIGTIVESRYNAFEAGRIVYHSLWMKLGLLFLVINLIFVVVDRWPWQRKHVPFILAHFGIIILVFGSLLTQAFGLDGQMYLSGGQKVDWFSIQKRTLTIYSSFDGNRYTELLQMKDLNFYSADDISRANSSRLAPLNFKILNFAPYAELTEKITPSTRNYGPAVQFILKNQNVTQVSWLVQSSRGRSEKIALGKAEFYLGELGKKSDMPHMVLTQLKKDCLTFELYNKESFVPEKKGSLCIGDKVLTPWMGLEFQLLNYYEKAQRVYTTKILERPTATSVSALQIQFENLEPVWVPLNDTVKYFSDSAVFIVRYGDELITTPFQIFLKEFKMEQYPGTERASSYKSIVATSDSQKNENESEISMNEPLKIDGFTLYQASFEKDQTGKPIASVLSVNVDPGRWFKYFGSFLMSLGIALMIFDSRNKQIKVQKGTDI